MPRMSSEVWAGITPAELSPDEAAAELLRLSLDEFSGEEQALIKKYLGPQGLSGGEEKKFNSLRNQWLKKHEISFKDKDAVQDFYRQREEENIRSHSLQAEFFQAAENNDAEALKAIKEKYWQEYPDQLEAVEVLFGFRDFLLEQKKFEERTEYLSDKEFAAVHLSFTEFQFILTHFIIERGQDRKTMSDFWQVAEKIAKQSGSKHFDDLKRGLLSQAAAFSTMREIGLKPTLSNPENDAFDAVDMWTNKHTAVQIKGSKKGEEAQVIEEGVEEVSFPATRITRHGKTNYVNTNDQRNSMTKLQRFSAKVKELSQRMGEEIKGVMIVIPEADIDQTTGQPSKKFVQFCREKFKE